jgi:HEAT repeat protein
MWGLISKGAAAAPYAVELLGRSVPEAREDGAAILAELGRDEAAVDQLVGCLETETDTIARDSIILALGRLKNRKALGSLAAIVQDASADGDTRWLAIESLGRVVGKRFLKQENPVEAAMAWLDRHPR